MNAHDRAVDHLHLAVVRLHDGVHQLVPDASFPPAIEPVVDRRVGTVALGKIAPGAARAQDVEHPVHDLPVVLRFRPAPIHGQQRLDDAPLEVREIVTGHDPCSDVAELESLFVSRG